MKLDLRGNYSLDLIIPMSLICLAELLIFLGNMKAALMIHALNLVMLILSATYMENRVYPALMLLPLFRLLNIAMPVFFQLTIYSYSLVYAPMFIPIFFIIREKMFSFSELGITSKGFWFYLPLGVAVGLALGWGEHTVLQSGVLIPDISPKSIMILSLIMIIFVGIVEEFVFRSALQTVMEERLGSVMGLLATSILFGIMHSGYHIPLELIYVSFAGLVFGLLFWMTRSLPVIALTHGVTNISLFLLAPSYPETLIYLIAIPGLLFLLCALLCKRAPRKVQPSEGS